MKFQIFLLVKEYIYNKIIKLNLYVLNVNKDINQMMMDFVLNKYNVDNCVIKIDV